MKRPRFQRCKSEGRKLSLGRVEGGAVLTDS